MGKRPGPAVRFATRDTEIFTRWRRGASQTVMGRDYGVTVQHIHKIIQAQWSRELQEKRSD